MKDGAHNQIVLIIRHIMGVTYGGLDIHNSDMAVTLFTSKWLYCMRLLLFRTLFTEYLPS